MRRMDAILLIDDTPDAGDVIRALRGVDGAFVIHARDATTMDMALDSGHVRLVVVEYALAWINGCKLVANLSARLPGLPVIMCTGAGDERVAVDAIMAGAADYVAKSAGGYARLPRSATHALSDAMGSYSTGDVERRYRSLFNAVPIGLYRTTASGSIVEANPALVAMMGYPDRETFLKVNAVDLYVRSEDRDQCLEVLDRDGIATNLEIQMRRYDGSIIWVRDTTRAVTGPEGAILCYEGALEDITQRVTVEQEREKLIHDLRVALAQVDTLRGLLPICAQCKRIRDDRGYWQNVEVYVSGHSQAQFTHGLCPECIRELYPEFAEPEDATDGHSANPEGGSEHTRLNK